ncbi:F-box protein [Senna tora]|uniref:F-box protein n=1 Tax=Senna tora TaxID=362788 RepID=A0A834TD74_9FABA|nr:F-box protein [Senna tora]
MRISFSPIPAMVWETISVGGKEMRISFSPIPCVDYCDSMVSEDDRGFRYFVCNPTTMQFATVTFPNKQFRGNIITLNLVFDPLRSPHYKIVSIRGTDQGKRLLNVYSSETGSWSDRAVCFTPPPHMAHGAPVYFNGAILWHCEDKNSQYLIVDTQCLKTLPMPKAIKYDFSGWFVRYRVDLTPMHAAFPELVWNDPEKVHAFSVLGVFQHPKEEDSNVVLFVDGRAMSFNLASHASRKLCDLEPGFKMAGAALDYEGRDAYLYFENLSCVKFYKFTQPQQFSSLLSSVVKKLKRSACIVNMSVCSRNILQKLSEEIAGNIDILTEILLRLPPKPLGKFKSVSKHWLALISDPKFCHSHTLRHHSPHPLPSALFLSDDSPNFDFVPISDSVLRVPPLDYLNAHRVSIIQSCNGLLLCSSGFLMPHYEQLWQMFSVGGKQMPMPFPMPGVDFSYSMVSENDRGFRYFVCNPTTTQFAIVTFPNNQFKNSIVALNLAFDPLRSPHYKIISFRDHTDAKKFVINVYSSETCRWSDGDICFTPPPRMAHRSPVYFNGAILWYSHGKNSLYFDVESQCLKTFPMPKEITHDSYDIVDYFRECGGHCYMVIPKCYSTLKFKILELKQDFSRWFVRYRVDLTPMKVAFPELCWGYGGVFDFSVLGVFQQPKEQDSKVVLFVEGSAISFNLATHASRELCDFRHFGTVVDYGGCNAHLYFENMSYVKGFPAYY